MKMNEVKAMIMDKTAEQAKEIIEANGYEIMSEMDDCFEYSNGSHVFTVAFDEEGVYNVYKTCSIGEYEEEWE